MITIINNNTKEAEERRCMYFRTFPAIEQRTASADRECTELVTRQITIPDEIYGFTFWTFCETHWNSILKWALRQDEVDGGGVMMDKHRRSLN